MVTQEVDGGGERNFWLVDGRLHSSRVQVQTGGLDQGDHVPTRMTLDCSPMLVRLRHMDELGTDFRFSIPRSSFFLSPSEPMWSSLFHAVTTVGWPMFTHSPTAVSPGLWSRPC